MTGLYPTKPSQSLDAPIRVLLLWHMSHFQPCALPLCQSHVAKGRGEEGHPTQGITLLQVKKLHLTPLPRGCWLPDPACRVLVSPKAGPRGG